MMRAPCSAISRMGMASSSGVASKSAHHHRPRTRPDFRITAVSCRDDHTGWSQAEVREDYRVVLARRGRFRRQVAGTPAEVDPTTAYLGVPGEEERFAHPAAEPRGDRGAPRAALRHRRPGRRRSRPDRRPPRQGRGDARYNLNQSKAAIEAWLKGPPPPADGHVEPFHSTVPNDQTSGRSVFKALQDDSDPTTGYKGAGINAETYDVKGIDTRIKYDSSRNPPFTVMTSMPSKS
ncbi:hypothetical protein [Streptomyces narbonensis]|uniref:hypothetical protein n=1 Tax=Streptomyces narbonensis TaxID=67333 RepID=UPI0033E9FD8E